MKIAWINILIFCSASLLQAQTLTYEIVETNTFIATGSQMQQGKWQNRGFSLPEGAAITITAVLLDSLQNNKQSQERQLAIRLRPTDTEYLCDSRGRWTSGRYSFSRSPQVTLTIPEGALLQTTVSANASFRVKTVLSRTVSRPALIPTNTESVKTNTAPDSSSNKPPSAKSQ